MGKLKVLFWLVVIGLVAYSFIMWFIANPADAGRVAGGAVDGVKDFGRSLGIFWSALFK